MEQNIYNLYQFISIQSTELMYLIDDYVQSELIHQTFPIFNTHLIHTLQSFLHLTYGSLQTIHDELYSSLVCDIKHIMGIDLYGKLVLQNDNTISLTISLFNKFQIKPMNNTIKGTLIRYFLITSFRYQNMRFIISPESGSISIKINFNYSNLQTSNLQQIETYIVQIIRQFNEYANNHIFGLLYHLNFETQDTISDKYKFNINQLKGFIAVSSFYAWNMLKALTQSKREKLKSQYQQFRRKLYTNMKSQEINHQILLLSDIFNKKINKSKIQFPTIQQQKDFETTYLSQNYGINKKNNIVNQITGKEQLLNELVPQNEIKIQDYKLGKLNLKIIKSHSPRYQRQILNKFPNFQFLGLPKFYFIKNKDMDQFKIMITNLVSSVTYNKYFSSNSKTISIITKLHILYQIALSTKHCRDYGILHHKIKPQNIYIKKGLYTKLTDFSFAYHPEIKNADGQNLFFKIPIQSSLPYVSNFQLTCSAFHNDEKTDVYSLGNIIYQTIIGKTPYHMKYGGSHTNSSKTQIDKICRAQLISPQKFVSHGDQHFWLLGYLSLECIQYTLQQNQKSDQNSKMATMSINSRPYLDWIVVIIRSILQNEKRKTMV